MTQQECIYRLSLPLSTSVSSQFLGDRTHPRPEGEPQGWGWQSDRLGPRAEGGPIFKILVFPSEGPNLILFSLVWAFSLTAWLSLEFEAMEAMLLCFSVTLASRSPVSTPAAKFFESN